MVPLYMLFILLLCCNSWIPCCQPSQYTLLYNQHSPINPLISDLLLLHSYKWLYYKCCNIWRQLCLLGRIRLAGLSLMDRSQACGTKSWDFVMLKWAVSFIGSLSFEVLDLYSCLFVVVFNSGSPVVLLVYSYFLLLILGWWLVCFRFLLIERLRVFVLSLVCLVISFWKVGHFFLRGRSRPATIKELTAFWFWQRNWFRQFSWWRSQRFRCRSSFPSWIIPGVFWCSHHLYITSFCTLFFTASPFLIKRKLLADHKSVFSDILQVPFHIRDKLIEGLNAPINLIFSQD